MMRNMYCLSCEELDVAKATLIAAKQFGFIEEAGFAAMENRCALANQKNQQKLKMGELVYGVTHYSPAAYLQYELTQFKLDFLSGKAVAYSYRQITEGEKLEYYSKNQDLFTDYDCEYYDYESVKEVIEKRLREEEFYGYIQDILCQLREGE